MKKVFCISLLTAIALGAVLSCSKEEVVSETGKTNPEVSASWTFTAKVENVATKVSYDESEHTFAWEGSEAVKIIWSGGSTQASATINDGNVSFTPEGEDLPSSGTTVWIVYPSNLGLETLSGATVDGSGNLSVPMPTVLQRPSYFVAKASVGDASVSFNHAFCYYRFVVNGDGEDVTKLTLSSAANNIAATNVTVSLDGSGKPSLTGSAKSVTSAFSGSGERVFYVPVIPVGTTAASDLTFKFYRNVDEKAGGYKHSKEVTTTTRANIVNWGTLPAMATNRYVATTGGTKKTGTASDKWDLAAFQGFLENTPGRTAETLELFNGIKVHFTGEGETVYKFTSTIHPDINIKVNLVGDISSRNAKLDGNSTYCLFDNYNKAAMNLSFKNLTIQYGKNSSDNGGAFRIASGTISLENCSIYGNTTTSNSKGGGAVSIWGSSKLTCTNCTFRHNSAAGYGGVILAEGTSEISLDNCTFGGSDTNQPNTSTGIASCIYLDASASLKANNCLFDSNSSDRYVIYVASSASAAAVYLNRISFKSNVCTKNANGWGMVVASDATTRKICMNNVTAFGNTLTNDANDWSVFNSNGGWLITNSTIINDARTALVRTGKTATVKLCNNILINTKSGNSNNVINLYSSNTSSGYNLLSCSSDWSNFTTVPSDSKSVTSLTSGNYDVSKKVYTWTNTSYKTATKAGVRTIINDFDSAFGKWLDDIGEWGNDGRGKSRGNENWWPGAYQNN